MTLQSTLIEPGQVWVGTRRDHLWTVRVTGLSAQAVRFATLGRGARGVSRVRGGHERQCMSRPKFLAQFRLDKPA